MTVDNMRASLQTFCDTTPECNGNCVLHTPSFRCGRGVSFMPRMGMSDNDIKNAYCTVFGTIGTKTETEADNVNHPAHYTRGGIECLDAIAAEVGELTGMEAVYTAQCIKYLRRWKWENGAEDLKKARFYLDKLIAMEEKT